MLVCLLKDMLASSAKLAFNHSMSIEEDPLDEYSENIVSLDSKISEELPLSKLRNRFNPTKNLN